MELRNQIYTHRYLKSNWAKTRAFPQFYIIVKDIRNIYDLQVYVQCPQSVYVIQSRITTNILSYLKTSVR